MTGEEATDEEAPSPFKGMDKPIVALVADTTMAMVDFDKLEEVVFKNEKIGLAMKAFRAVRISPEDADSDPILAGEGKTLPRVVVIDPVKEKVKVLEEKKIKVSSLYKAMKSVAGKFYKEKLDKVVKSHLKLLNERDKLHNEEKVLKDKETRLVEKGEKGAKDLEKIKEELEEVAEAIKECEEKWVEIWQLTPKHKKSPA